MGNHVNRFSFFLLFQEAATSTQSASSDSSSNEEKMMITINAGETDELIIADPLDSWATFYVVDNKLI